MATKKPTTPATPGASVRPTEQRGNSPRSPEPAALVAEQNEEDDEIDEASLKGIQAYLDRIKKRDAEDYDAVMGLPPHWVPKPFHDDARNARNKLLDEIRLPDDSNPTPDIVRSWVNKYIKLGDSDEPSCQWPDMFFDDRVMDNVGVLAHIYAAFQLGPEKGLALLIGKDADSVTHWGKYRERQSKIAKHPRGRVVAKDDSPLGDTSTTINEIIDSLVRMYAEETAKDLWPNFYSELDALQLNPRECPDKDNPNKSLIEYDFQGKRKSITFGRFSNIASERRVSMKSR